ncbi:MAG: YifB family Mg chelatase-like AAA ATPase [Clostridiales bacterium]|nr:YifB family Mg chelatase-like AAA ATPase [Clostridiales bacterium]
MLSRIKSYALDGLRGYSVSVEVDISPGVPAVDIVGLPDTAVKESSERVHSAIKNSGFYFSPRRITVNLAPAHTKKGGSAFDLAIALGMLVSTEQAGVDDNKKPLSSVSDCVFLGELSLSGEVRKINGVMPILISAKERGINKIVIPYGNANEARYIQGIEVYAVKTLREAVDIINGVPAVPVEKSDIVIGSSTSAGEDLKFVKGQYSAKRALEIAAAGGHNMIMIGAPGGGKTMLAKCIPGILPDMTEAEALETTKIHSVAGILDDSVGIVTVRPFRSPHHTASKIALTGGGSTSHPGEISFAHNGVLFLDELPEYPRAVLEILRQPLEDGVITVSRAARTVEYPANFMLVASMNPCPCGYYGSATHDCSCTPAQIQKYMGRISGPLLDRIDIHVEVDEVRYDELTSSENAESSNDVKERVNAARKLQTARFKGSQVHSNSKMTSEMIKTHCALDASGERILSKAFEKLGFSARAYTRILKVARTVADLDGNPKIESKHVAEAIMYRSLDKAVR